MTPRVAIIGGGSAGLSFAASIDTNKYSVTLFEKKNRAGSKLLVAGKGGFNLTHSESLDALTKKYRPQSFLKEALTFFSNIQFVSFLKAIGVETYVGSSKRIFPIRPTKPITVLKALENKVKNNKVTTIRNAEWVDIRTESKLIYLEFLKEDIKESYEFDYVIFALGGASWKVTGSEGNWLSNFKGLDLATVPFAPSNCAIKVSWNKALINEIAGQPLKNIAVSINNNRLLGEVMITAFGLEGSPIYALSHAIRDGLSSNNFTEISLDFKPHTSTNQIITKLNTKQNGSWSNHLKTQLKLSSTQMRLLKARTSKPEFQSAIFMADLIKNFSCKIEGLAPIDEAISTVGGIALTEVNAHFQLKKHPEIFILGEMLDWDAPTGGYLIQGCMSMGQYAANFLNKAVH